MLLKARQILSICHKNHQNSTNILTNMYNFIDDYCITFVKKYIFRYVQNCTECKSKLIQKFPSRESQTSDIDLDILQASQNPVNFTLKCHTNQQITYDHQNCPYNCTQDNYDEYYTFIHDTLCKRTKEIIQGKTMYKQKYGKTKITKDLSQCRIIKCNKQTEHLWKIGYKYRNKPKNSYQHLSVFEIYKRIPMENQKIIVAKILHGNCHRTYQKMVQNISKLPFLFNVMKDYIQNNPYYCDCCPYLLKQQQKISKSLMIATTVDSLSSNFQGNSDINSHEFEKQNANKIKLQLAKQEIRKIKLLQKINKMNNKHLKSNNILIKSYQSKTQKSNIIIISTLQMQKLYLLYGDCLYFENFSQFIDIKQSWQTFFFSGIDQNQNEIVFAGCLLDQLTFETFYFALKLFFQIMCNIYPKTICTVYDDKLTQSINSLTYYSQQPTLTKLKHIYYWKSIIPTVSQLLSKQRKSNGLISLFVEAIKTHCLIKFNNIVQKLKIQLGQQSNLYRIFMSQREKLCWVYLPRTFIGSHHGYSQTQNVLKILKCNLPMSTTSVQFIKNFTSKFVNGFHKTTSIPTSTLQKVFAPQLSSLTETVSQKIMQKLAQRCIETLKINSIKSITETEIEVYDEQGKFYVEYCVISDHWICSCAELEKTGLPCIHLIAILKTMGGDVSYYVSQRWKNIEYIDQKYLYKEMYEGQYYNY